MFERVVSASLSTIALFLLATTIDTIESELQPLDHPLSNNDTRTEFAHVRELAAYVATIANGWDTNRVYVYHDSTLQTDIVERIVRHPLVKPLTLHK